MKPLNKILLFRFFVCIILIIATTSAFPQAKSEEEVKKNANELFLEKNYADALPLYSQLLSLYPKDPNYSYRLGTCKLFAEKDKEEPLTFLEFAVKNPNVDAEAFFYMGVGYHLNYRFDEALVFYKKFKQKADPKKHKNIPIDQQIAMCESGMKLLKNITDLVVIEKKKLPLEDFYKAYDLSGFGGKLIVKPEEFIMPGDKEKGNKLKEQSVMFTIPGSDVLYFSSYGEKGKSTKDIYYVRKLPNGEFGKPLLLDGDINTPFDEDYPFVHPNGKIMYFSSNGHNSMGGYDVFMSYYDEETGRWGKPVNMDFAINTPGDDYLYITDPDGNTAWFASTRESVYGEIVVYKINSKRVPVDIALIKGTFFSDATKSAKITVEDMLTKRIIGEFNSDVNTGDYILTIPNGGRFKFIVETDESPVAFTGIVPVPKQKELSALKQEIRLVVENGSEKLIIKNLFDEQVVAEGILVPAKTLKQKASLEVNIEERKTDIVKDSIESNTDTLSLAEEVISDEQPIKDTTEVVRPKLIEKSDISNKEIIDMAYKDADALRKEASEMKNQAEIAYQIANQKNELAIQKNAEAEKLQNEGAPVENVKSLKTSSKEYAEQAIVAVTLAKEIEQKAIKKEEEAKLAFRYADEIESAINTSTAEEAAVKIEQLNQFLETQKQNQDADFAYNQFKTRLEEKQKSANNKIEYANKLNREVEEQEEDIKALKQEAEKSSKKDKERLLEQAAILENELPEMKEKARIAGEEANNAQSQLLVLEREESLLSSVITELKSTDTSFVAELSSAEKSELETKISKTEIELAKANADETYINNNTKSDSLASQNNSSNAKSEDKSLTTDSLSVQNKIADNMGKQADSAIVSIQPKDSALVKQNEPKTIEKQDSAIVSENINIENNDSDTLLLSNISLYSSKYIQTENEAKAITNLYDRAITLSDINKVWMEELENEITNLEKSKINIKNTEKLAKVDEVIRQLEKLSSEKRTAANNYKSEAENIRLKEALFADKDSVTIDYDTYFSNKIEVQSSQSDLTLSEKNKAIIYNAWADSLENEIAEIKQELAEAETEEDKSVLNEEIAQLEKEVNEKRILASGKQTLLASSDSLTVSENKINNTDTTSAVLSENLKGTSFADSSQTSTATESIIANQTFITPDVQLPATTSSVDFYNEASQLNEEYETNQAEAISLRQQAESTKNKSEKAQLLASAEEKEKLATEKQLEYTLALEKAEAVKSAEYQPISTVQQEKRQSAEWTEKSEALRAESESLNTKSAEIYAQAETTKNKKEKEALVIEANKLKQQSEIKQKEADNAQTIAQEVELIEKRKYLDAIVLNEKSRKQDTTQTTAIEPAEMDYVANALEYKIYEQNKKEYTKLYKEAEVLNTQSATYRKDAEDQERVAAALIAQSDEITNEDEKQKIIQEAEAIKAQAAVNRLKADSLSIVSNTKQNKADEMALKTIANLVSNDESMYEKALAYDAYKNRTTTKPVSDDTTLIAQNRINQADTISTVTNKAEEKIVADNSSLSDDNIKSEVKNNIQKDTVQDKTAGAKQDNKIISSIDYIPPVLKSEIFAPSDNPSVSAYSSSNPIPVDVKLPEGLVFKVQVGAFRNPIPQDVFKGFSPIVGEKVGDLTKYTAGFFVSFTNADIAKNKIRQLGYNDAFVVAYYNGKRISVTEARTMPASAVAEVASNVTKGTLNNPDSISQPKNIIADNINETSTASSGENVKAIKGLFFTVQIGVYSRLVSPEELKNVSYINFENLENGNIRYTSGRYSDIAPALEAKDNIVQKGIRDAFVTAYFNGKRITVAEARTIASSGAGRDLAVATNQINKDENSNNPENNASDNSGNILFKVQVGPYRGNVPNEHAGPILRFSSSGVEVGRDEAGATIYNFGSFSDFESAKRLKDEIFTGGLQNSTVVAYRNGRKMNLEEAKKQSGR